MKKLAVLGIGVGLATIGLYTGISLYTAKVAEAKINDLIKEVEDEVVIQYRDVSTQPFKAAVVVKDVSLAPVEAPDQVITIDQVTVRKLEEGTDFPTALDASMQGIKFSADQVNAPAVKGFLQKAGYQETLSLNLDTKYQYQEASQEVTLEQFRLGAKDLGYLEVTFRLGNVTPEMADANANVIVHAAKITYQDDSFAEKLIAAIAAENNQEVGQFKTQLQAGLQQNAQLLLSPDNPAAMAALDGAIAFIENPEGFSISVNPPQPVTVSELAAVNNPQAWVDLLNLQIEAY